jgi:agmatinase
MSTFEYFLRAQDELIPGGWAILGVPLDETGSYRKGAGGGPDAIRQASDCLEEYCPISDHSLGSPPFADLGNLALPSADCAGAQEVIARGVADILDRGAHPMLLGGEHSVSVAAIAETAARHEDLCVLQFDAHADLRHTYDSTPLSHACVMRRALEVVGSSNLFQVGIRSGTKEEWGWMRAHHTMYPAEQEAVRLVCERIGGRPVYLSLDLDILDPSILPGTGTPEPGGPDYREFERLLFSLLSLNIVAADVVELAPALDPSGVSAVVAAKVVRSLLSLHPR